MLSIAPHHQPSSHPPPHPLQDRHQYLPPLKKQKLQRSVSGAVAQTLPTLPTIPESLCEGTQDAQDTQDTQDTQEVVMTDAEEETVEPHTTGTTTDPDPSSAPATRVVTWQDERQPEKGLESGPSGSGGPPQETVVTVDDDEDDNTQLEEDNEDEKEAVKDDPMECGTPTAVLASSVSPVVVEKDGKVGKVGKVDKVGKMGKVGKVDKVDKVGKVDKMDKVDKVGKVDKVDKVDKMDKVDKVGKMDKMDKVNKVDKVDKTDAVDTEEQDAQPVSPMPVSPAPAPAPAPPAPPAPLPRPTVIVPPDTPPSDTESPSLTLTLATTTTTPILHKAQLSPSHISSTHSPLSPPTTLRVLFYTNLRLRGAIEHTYAFRPMTADDLVHDGGAFGQYYEVEEGLPEYRLAVVPNAVVVKDPATVSHRDTWVHDHRIQRKWLDDAVHGTATTWWDHAVRAHQFEVHVFTPPPRTVTLHYRTYDIRDKLLQFDSRRILHKNSPWVGTRYVCVFYNKDLNYKGSTLCERSVRLQQQQPPDTVWVATAAESETLQYVRRELLREMERTTFPEERARGTSSSAKYGHRRGTFISFGVTQSRGNRKHRQSRGLHTRKHTNENNRKFAALYTALCRFTDLFKPGLFGVDDSNDYHACIVAKNSQCEWHTDVDNLGGCAIVGMGKYSGGVLMMGC